MVFSTRSFNRNRCETSKNLISILAATMIGLVGLGAASTTSSALSLGPSVALGDQAKAPNTDVVKVRAVVRRGGVAVGPRGNAAAYRSRTVVRGGAVVRPGYRGGGVRWARPGWYRWPAGGAIAAGAAIGFVAAASAAAYAGAAPAPGMCWYYTDPSRTQGFWDNCP